jgi:fumarylacetoacetase
VRIKYFHRKITVFDATSILISMSSTPSQFGVDNVPFGIATSSQHPTPQVVSRFEDHVVFLAPLASAGIIAEETGMDLEKILSEVGLIKFNSHPF